MISQLVELRQEESSDEYGILRLDEDVFLRARDLLINAAITLVSEHDGTRMPHGCASTDSEGGLRVEWVRDDMNVHLVMPLARGSIPPYIFHKFGNVKAIEKTVSPSSLAHLISQIND